MDYKMISVFKANLKMQTEITINTILNRIEKYHENLSTSPFEKKFINIHKIFIKNEKDLSQYSSLYFSEITQSEIGDFLISGGLIWAFPVYVNADNKYEALGQIDKLLALKKMVAKGKLTQNFAVMCYVVEKEKVIATNEYKVILPINYYQLWYYPEFFSKELNERKNLLNFNDEDVFFSTKDNNIAVIETYNFFTDEFLVNLYKSDKNKFSLTFSEKILMGVKK
jgi:hypothetical protein